jgi:hypothetical protein
MLRGTQLVDQADRNPAVAPILMKFQRGCHQVSILRPHKVHIYTEYHSVCPLVGIGTLTPTLACG